MAQRVPQRGGSTYAQPMHQMIALLRGINVGKAKRIAMADLRDLFTELGHQNVKTYIVSGNVTFDSATSDEAALTLQISKAIADRFGFEVSVVVIGRSELRNVASDSPLLDQIGDPKHLIVTVLDGPPDPDLIEAIDRAAYLPESFVTVGRSVHVHCPNGQAEMQMNNAFWEKTLGQVATTRTWRTMSKLIELSS